MVIFQYSHFLPSIKSWFRLAPAVRCPRYNFRWYSWVVIFGSFMGIMFSTNYKSDHHDITDMLLKVAFNTITKPKFDHIKLCRMRGSDIWSWPQRHCFTILHCLWLACFVNTSQHVKQFLVFIIFRRYIICIEGSYEISYRKKKSLKIPKW